MSGFISGMEAHLLGFLGNPTNSNYKLLLLAAAWLAMFAVLDRATALLGSPLKGPGGGFGAALLGAALLLAGLALADMVVPVDIQAHGNAYKAGAMTVLTAGVVAPAISRLYAVEWVKALVAWLLGMGLVAGVVQIVHAASDSTGAGVENTQKFMGEPDY